MKSTLIVLLLMFSSHCRSQQTIDEERNILEVYGYTAEYFRGLLTQVPDFDGFDFPICKPEGSGCYDANPFGVDEHLGEDWNQAGNNKDLGKPIHAIGNGIIVYAKDIGGGWGNVLRVIHKVPRGKSYEYVEALYAHFKEMLPGVGTKVHRGQKIGTIGTAGGIYEAHLHLELRSQIAMPVGGGYSSQTDGFLEPKVFIRVHRPQQP